MIGIFRLHEAGLSFNEIAHLAHQNEATVWPYVAQYFSNKPELNELQVLQSNGRPQNGGIIYFFSCGLYIHFPQKERLETSIWCCGKANINISSLSMVFYIVSCSPHLVLPITPQHHRPRLLWISENLNWILSVSRKHVESFQQT